MVVTQLTGKSGTVTIKGRVILPLGKPVQKITIKRRISCSKSVTAKTLRPDSKGRFSVTLAAPKSTQTAHVPPGDQGGQERAQRRGWRH